MQFYIFWAINYSILAIEIKTKFQIKKMYQKSLTYILNGKSEKRKKKRNTV